MATGIKSYVSGNLATFRFLNEDMMESGTLLDIQGIYQFNSVKLNISGREQEPSDNCRAFHDPSMCWDSVLRLPHTGALDLR